MRDERYKETSLPRPVRKLCRMAVREADRARPDRLRDQAVAAILSDISPDFRGRLRDHHAVPSLFGANDIVAAARTRPEAEIARNIHAGRSGEDAICEALHRLGEGYAREQKCQLVADRYSNATTASESVKRAFEDAAPIAATLILRGQSFPKTDIRIRLTENLLVQPSGGVGR
jgi:hypothetical protein